MSLMREFELSDANFERIRQFVVEHTGIVLSGAKKDMVYGRLSKRIRNGPHTSFDGFCDALEAGDEQEQEFMINAITTNLTAFFRENHHFEYLEKTIIPALINSNTNKRLRIWSAGCSTGEEPYSIAITLKQAIPDIEQWDVKILATDLDANVLARAKAGIFHFERIAALPESQRKRWFKRGRGDNQDNVKVSAELQDLITFKRLNLLHEWPMKGVFDVIFCRNVVIYFDKETQRSLFDRYADILTTNGHLFIGHSESLYKVTNRFDALGNTIYKKNGQ